MSINHAYSTHNFNIDNRLVTLDLNTVPDVSTSAYKVFEKMGLPAPKATDGRSIEHVKYNFADSFFTTEITKNFSILFSAALVATAAATVLFPPASLTIAVSIAVVFGFMALSLFAVHKLTASEAEDEKKSLQSLLNRSHRFYASTGGDIQNAMKHAIDQANQNRASGNLQELTTARTELERMQRFYLAL